MYRLALRWTRTLPKDSTQFAGYKMHIIPLGGLPGCLHAALGPHLAAAARSPWVAQREPSAAMFPWWLEMQHGPQPRIQGARIDPSPGYKGLGWTPAQDTRDWQETICMGGISSSYDNTTYKARDRNIVAVQQARLERLDEMPL